MGDAIDGFISDTNIDANSHSATTLLDTDGNDTLSASTDPLLGKIYTFKLLTSDTKWIFDDAGRIRRVVEPNGWVMTYGYDAVGRLQSITNAFGRQLTFNINDQALTTQVNLPDGGNLLYQFDASNRLISVRYPDNSIKTYLYENASFPLAITGIQDENSKRWSTYTYDNLGRAISSELAGGADRSTVQYQSNTTTQAISGQPIYVTDALGTRRGLSYTSPKGYLSLKSADQPAAGSATPAATNFTDVWGLIKSETDFRGFFTNYFWSDIGRRLPSQIAEGASAEDAGGLRLTSYTWHSNLRIPISIQENGGKRSDFTYDAVGNMLIKTEKDEVYNQTYPVGYSASYGQTRTWAFTNSPQNLPLTMTDPRGQTWTFAYDTAGNRTSITNPLGHVSTSTFDGTGRVLTETAPNGLVTSYQYDPRGRATRIIHGSNLAAALQQIAVYAYRPSGQIASAILPNGHAIAYSYDDAQRLIGATDNRGNSIAYTLDAMGNRTKETIKDASSQIALASSRVINSLNRAQSISGGTSPAQQTFNLQYDANGEPIQSTDPLGNVTKTALDALRRPTATTLPDNSSATMAYNQLNHLISAKDPKAVQTTMRYNAWGELLSETSPDIGTVIYTRDKGGNILTMTDAKNQTTSYQYDALSRVTNITFADGKQQTFLYDGTATGQQKGYLREMQDASGNTRYERDSFGRITKKTQTVLDNPANPTVLISQYTYTQAGELASLRYPSGLTVAYTRNTSGQISGITTKIGSAAAQPFVQNISYTALEQPKAWNWEHCTTVSTALSPCTSASRSFDQDGRMTASNLASYQYDASSRITAITQNLIAQRSISSTSGTATITTTQLYQQPISWTVGYDNRDRITSFMRTLNSGSGQQSASSESFTYDPNSNRLSSISIAATDTDKDGLYETSEQRKNTTRILSIQPTSNKLQGFAQTLTTLTGTRTNSTVASQINYTLDANGNLTSDGLRDFQYDADNRLSKVILGSTFVGTDSIAGNELAAHTYLHNAAGQRVFKSEPKTQATAPNEATLGTGFVSWLQTNFSWLWATAQTNATLGNSYTYADGALPSWALLGEYGNGGASSTGRTEYIWLPTANGQAIPIGLYRSGQLHAIHTDHLGTPRLMVDRNNTPVWQWAYSAFGDNAPTGILKPTTSAGSAFISTPAGSNGNVSATMLATSNPTQVNNLRFPGQYADSETGLFYNYFRTYQPNQGRYTQNDPIGLDGGWNRYSYVDADPINYTDPDGLAKRPGGRPTRDNTPKPPTMSTNSGAQNLINMTGNMPTFPETNLPGAWPGINYIPPITRPVVLPPTGPGSNGCTIIYTPASPNQCPATPTTRLVCGPNIGPR